MKILNAGYSATLTLATNDVVTVNPRASVVVEAVSGLGLSAGVIATSIGPRTFGPYPAGVIKLTAVMGDCVYGAGPGAVDVDAVTNPLTGGVSLSAGGAVILNTKMLVWSSGLPFVMPSSGTINNTAGSVTVSTAFDYVIGPSYTFFPSGALFASSPAGWYYTNWTAATIGTAYANTYANGAPSIPASPVPLTTVAGPYTQTTSFDVIGPNVVVPENFMGSNGTVEWQRVVNNNNSAGSKIYNTFFGGVNFQGLTQTTNPKEAGAGSLKNRGRKTAQISASAAHGDSGNASTLPKLSIDTSQNQILSMSIQLATATDFAVIESFLFRVTSGD